MLTSDFDYDLPAELIAQRPVPQRDRSRLLVLERASGNVSHHEFRDLVTYLRSGDVLALNNSRVIPARLRAVNARSGGQFEILLLEENAVNDWWVALRPGRRARTGTRMVLRDHQGRFGPAQAEVIETNVQGHRRLRFTGMPNLSDVLDVFGEVPLPPYIQREPSSSLAEDLLRYQTVFAEAAGSIAAPTAGLHFTEALLEQIKTAGVGVCFLTLHVGFGTFAPVKTEHLTAHRMHEEHFQLSAEAAATINETRRRGGRVFAVGTTTARTLESVARQGTGPLRPGSGQTQLFIHPPFDFKVVDALVTNFHLPRSTLLMLASAFVAPKDTAGRELLLAAYAAAIRHRYRFFSYGDAMLIL